MQCRACIASRMLSSSVVSPRQTLRELARDHKSELKLNPAHQLVVPRMHLLTRAHHNAPRVCTSVLFIFEAFKFEAFFAQCCWFRGNTHKFTPACNSNQIIPGKVPLSEDPGPQEPQCHHYSERSELHHFLYTTSHEVCITKSRV